MNAECLTIEFFPAYSNDALTAKQLLSRNAGCGCILSTQLWFHRFMSEGVQVPAFPLERADVVLRENEIGIAS